MKLIVKLSSFQNSCVYLSHHNKNQIEMNHSILAEKPKASIYIPDTDLLTSFSFSPLTFLLTKVYTFLMFLDLKHENFNLELSKRSNINLKRASSIHSVSK